jgi:hypothetical protein
MWDSTTIVDMVVYCILHFTRFLMTMYFSLLMVDL